MALLEKWVLLGLIKGNNNIHFHQFQTNNQLNLQIALEAFYTTLFGESIIA